MRNLLNYQEFLLENIVIYVAKDELDKYDIPESIKEHMKTWDKITKSTYSNSFYSTEVSWSNKPHNSFRVSDHWNFYTRDSWHCQTETPVNNNIEISLGQFNAETGKYKILMSGATRKSVEKIKKRMANREKAKRLGPKFKEMVNNREVYIDLEIEGEIITGLVDKYTGRELRIIDDKKGSTIYYNNKFEKQIRGNVKVSLYKKSGEPIESPFMI